MISIARFLTSALFLICVASSAFAKDRVDLIISRDKGSIEVFLLMPAAVAVSEFGLSRRDLTNAAGFADFKRFSEGTWDLGDKFWTVVNAKTSGSVAHYEAMSLMMHPRNRRLPFNTPFESLMSIEVCNVTTQNVTLSESDVYVGLISYTSNTNEALEFTFPKNAQAQLYVKDFKNHQLVFSSSIDLEKSKTVFIPEVAWMNSLMLYQLVSALMLAVIFTILALFASRDNGPYAA